MSSSLMSPRVLPLGIPYGFARKALAFLCYDSSKHVVGVLNILLKKR